MSIHIHHSGNCHNSHRTGGSWGSRFRNCCNRLFGPGRGGFGGMLAGGLIGGILGGGNPMMALLGGTIGGLLGGSMGNHNHSHCSSHQHPHHQQCASYPPSYGHQFGGPQMGGYCQPSNFGCSPFGQPHWGGSNNSNMNFNFGHQCPPSRSRRCCSQGSQGQLQQKGQGKPISYTTSGGYEVTVNKHTISVKDPSGKNVLKHWGDPHENLNGKHLKDWQGKQRSVVLGDGTKITMSADGPKGVTLNTSIYDGRQNVQINNKENKIEHHSFNPQDTRYREMNQYDGETALFQTGNNGVGVYNNIYNEDQNFGISPLYQQIGQTGGYQNPGKVYDFFEDPTHSKT